MLGCRYHHRCLCTATPRKADVVRRINPDHPVTHGGSKHRPHVHVAGLDRAGGKAGHVHRLDPNLHVRATNLTHRPVTERHRAGCERHRQNCVGSPNLSRGPFVVKRRERDTAGPRIDIHPGNHRSRDLIEPQLRIASPIEMPRRLLARLIAIPCSPLPVRAARDVACHEPPSALFGSSEASSVPMPSSLRCQSLFGRSCRSRRYASRRALHQTGQDARRDDLVARLSRVIALRDHCVLARSPGMRSGRTYRQGSGFLLEGGAQADLHSALRSS